MIIEIIKDIIWYIKIGGSLGVQAELMRMFPPSKMVELIVKMQFPDEKK